MISLILSLSLACGQDAVADARGLLENGELDAAVVALEEHLAGAPDDADAWRLLGRGLTRLVDEGGRSYLLLDDARRAWEEVCEREPHDIEPFQRAADLALRTGAFADASRSALRGLGLAQLAGSEERSAFVALALRARIGLLQTSESDLVRFAQEAAEIARMIEGARARAPEKTELVTIQSSFLIWLGLPEVAQTVLADGLRAAPSAVDLHKAFVDLHVSQGVEERLSGFYATLCTEHPRDATSAWYRGWAARLVGDLAQRERRFDDAIEAYNLCVGWMHRSAQLEESFAESARRLRVQARSSGAWCSLGKGDLIAAQNRFLTLIGRHGDLANEPDGLGRTVAGGLGAAGQKWVDRNDFEAAADLARRVTEVLTDDGPWWNNLGFLLREHGTAVESQYTEGDEESRAAAAAKGREIFERSWQAYVRAAELAADDARIVNDAALIQVYHLQTELDKAEAMLHTAIEIGERQLEELGAYPKESERFPIAQAVGDAYQNLGYLYYHSYEKPTEARPFFVAALATDSGDRSQLEDYLAAIDGTGEPVGVRKAPATAPRVLDSVPPPAPVAWQPALEVARRLGRAEGRPVLVYYRGSGLGLAVPLYDGWVTSERFVEIADGAIFAVGDEQRHNFVDRTRDGRRLACPRFGRVTCAEHLRVAEEFNELWSNEHKGFEPGESEEGLHAFPVGQDELVPVVRLRDVVPQPDPDSDPAPASAPVEDSAQPAELSIAQLFEIGGRENNDRIEELLFGRKTEPEVRASIVAALAARDGDDDARILLWSLARQAEDAELAEMALDAWPAFAGTGNVLFALAWSDVPRVRAAAARAYARVGGDLRFLASRLVVGPNASLRNEGYVDLLRRAAGDEIAERVVKRGSGR